MQKTEHVPPHAVWLVDALRLYIMRPYIIRWDLMRVCIMQWYLMRQCPMHQCLMRWYISRLYLTRQCLIRAATSSGYHARLAHHARLSHICLFHSPNDLEFRYNNFTCARLTSLLFQIELIALHHVLRRGDNVTMLLNYFYIEQTT